MPLNLSIPLPGPFTYTTRLGGRGGATWWLLVGWWFKPLVWLLYALLWSVVVVCVLTWQLLVLAARQVSAARARRAVDRPGRTDR